MVLNKCAGSVQRASYRPILQGGLERGEVYPLNRGPVEGSAEGGVRLLSEGSLLPLGEAEMRRAAGSLGREASGEAEIAF